MADDVERQTLTFPIGEAMQVELKKLEAEGWIIDTEKPPTSTFHIMRPVKKPGAVGIGELVIDESKIMILGADGTLR